MKGLILAGGAGKRLRPLTYTGAKQLVPVANRPVLFYVVDNIVDAGITDIGIVVSPEVGREIQAALGDGSQFRAKFTFILQDPPLGLAHAVSVARDFLKDDDFVVYLGDNLIGARISDAVEEFRTHTDLSAHVMLKAVPNPSAFGVAVVDSEGRVVRLVEKPKDPPSNLALVGIYMFRPSVFEVIRQLKPSARGEFELTDAISTIIERGGSVHFSYVTSWWLDTGKKDDMLLANDTVLDTWCVAKNDGVVDADSKVSGRVDIGKGARLERATVRGPVVIGAGARIVDARIGPFTSIGDDVTVERSTVEHSVIMEGSRILDIERLEDSLIGKRVAVRAGAYRHGALSLMVGDDCVIELSERGGTRGE